MSSHGRRRSQELRGTADPSVTPMQAPVIRECKWRHQPDSLISSEAVSLILLNDSLYLFQDTIFGSFFFYFLVVRGVV